MRIKTVGTAVFITIASAFSFSLFGVALPEGFRIAEDGKIVFPGGDISVWIAQTGWMGRVRFDKPTRSDGCQGVVLSGGCALAGVNGRYETVFEPKTENSFTARWSYAMDDPIDTAVNCVAVQLHHSDVKGVFIDGQYRMLPLVDGKEFSFNPKTLSFVLEGGRMLTVRHRNVHYIDNRRFGNDRSGFRLMMSHPSGHIKGNSLEVSFEVDDVPQGYCALNSDKGIRAAEIVSTNVVRNGGVKFMIGERVTDLTDGVCDVDLPKERDALGISLLHGMDGTFSDGEVIGRMDAIYEDGEVSSKEIVFGVDVGPCQGLLELKNAKPTCQKWNIVRFDGLYTSHFPLKRKNPVRLSFKPLKKGWRIAAVTMTEALVSFRAYDDRPLTIEEGRDWFPLEFTGNTLKGSPLDFSSFAVAPAGRDGMVRVRDGRFYLEKTGRGIRFNGANLCGEPLVAEPDAAEEMASRMVRCGLNAVRFHHYERELLRRNAKSGLDFDPARLDRFFNTWATCVRHGLYITYDIYASREVYTDEIAGVKNRQGLKVYKAKLPIDRAYVENLKDYCRRFLLRRNPYTGYRIADDPAVMGVNVVNEDDIGFYWLFAREDWTRAYAGYCAEHPELNSSADQTNPDFVRFLYMKQRAFHAEMVDFCRNEIGIQAPITSMNMTDRFDLVGCSENFDWVDKHCYYSHPNRLDPKQGALVPNAYSQTGSPIQAFASPAPRQIAFSRYIGKPMGCTEYNFCYPNQYRHEGVPLFMAYAAYQGWNAFFRFGWSFGLWSLNRPFRAVPFEEASDPIMQLSDRVAAALFIRGDLAEATHGYVIEVSSDGMPTRPQSEFSQLDTVAKVAVGRKGGALPDGWIAYTGQESLAGEDLKALELSRNRHRARTPDGQIDLDAENQTLRVVTPKTEVLSGGSGALSGDVLTLESIKGRQTVAVISLDGRSLRDSERAVIIHMPDVQNSGVRFNNELRTVQVNWGELPYLVRRVKSSVRLSVKRECDVIALNGDGKALGRMDSSYEDGCLRFVADPAAFKGGALAYLLDFSKKGE